MSEWESWAADHRAAAARWRFDVAGVDGAELRARARRRVLALAGVDGRSDGSDRGDGGPLFVTGHQPQFYHPGVWVKGFAVQAAAQAAGGFAVNWVVDHDAGGLEAEIPAPREGDVRGGVAGGDGGGRNGGGRGEHVRVRVHRLVEPKAGRPFETLPGPTPAEVRAFADRVDDDLSRLGLTEQRELGRLFAQRLFALAEEGEMGRLPWSAADAGWRGRAAYEEAFGVASAPDVPFSQVAGTREFLLFFVHWASQAERLLETYNGALARFREARRVRSRANPFPDLQRRPDGAVELPFWGLTAAGIRRKLYVRRQGDRLILTHLEGEFATIPADDGEGGVDGLLKAGVQVRPRAVPLTVFTRLFVADVFVHGTGGARYDEVTDLFIRDGFGVEPPRYAVVSATVHLPLGHPPVQPSALWGLRHKLRDLRFNPQRYAWEIAGANDGLDERLGQLLREKERLIEEIRKTPRGMPRPGVAPGAGPSAKRVLTRAIERTNAELYGLLGSVEQNTRERLARLELEARSAAAATRRTYPFFLYDPNEITTLLRNGGA